MAVPDRPISGSTNWRSRAKCRPGSRPNGHQVRRHRTVGAESARSSTSESGSPAALNGSVLTVGGRPRLVRAIDYNGEDFAWLQARGFNAVRLLSPPTPTQLREAEGSGVSLIAPPPLSQSPSEYGPNMVQVLAWDLGDSVSAELMEPTRRLATRLQSVPESLRRPTICLPRDDIWQYSRIADLIVLDPPGPQSSLPLADFGRWYLHRARLMRPGTQFWASIRTQIHPTVMEQARAMGDATQVAWSLEPEQIQLLAYHAIASGARGLWFRSESRLDATDRQTVLRAKTLEWLNLELQMLEAWAATGTHETELETGDPGVRQRAENRPIAIAAGDPQLRRPAVRGRNGRRTRRDPGGPRRPGDRRSLPPGGKRTAAHASGTQCRHAHLARTSDAGVGRRPDSG